MEAPLDFGCQKHLVRVTQQEFKEQKKNIRQVGATFGARKAVITSPHHHCAWLAVGANEDFKRQRYPDGQ